MRAAWLKWGHRWWRVLPLAFALLSASASAQVAGICGNGRRCQVRSVALSPADSSTSAICLAPSGSYFWRLYSTANSAVLGSTASTTACHLSTGLSNTVVWDFASQLNTVSLSIYSTSKIYAQYGLGSGATGAGTALASFPTCDGSATGRLLFDSTNAVWRFCDGSTWGQVGEESWNAFEPGTISATAFVGAYRAKRSHSTARMFCAARTAGVGAGNLTLYIWDGSNRCSVTVACTGQLHEITSGTSCTITAGNVYYVTTDVSGCAGTPPAVSMCNVVFE